MKNVEISTSVLTVEEQDAISVFYNLETAKTDYFHIDVMDGEFVEKNTRKLMLGYASTIKHMSNLPLDVHLMVKDIKSNIDEYLSIAPNIITIHYEACKSKEEVIELIKYLQVNNVKPGLSIKPNTPAEEIYEILPYLHLCLVMTVEPGKGGQELIPETVEKVKELKEYIDKNNLDTYIEVDGGINLDTADLVKNAGADILVVGSAIISSGNYKDTIEKLSRN